jgi:predicted DNA-binding ribbon-helix-helix protein
MGVHLLEGFWIAIDDLAQREVRSLDHLVEIIYGSHLELTSM